MKTKFCFLFFLMTILSLSVPIRAQKLFTLEDLNFGGRNYHNLRPQNMFLTWWGDQLMYQDAEECGTVDDKGQRTPLLTLDDLNAVADGEDTGTWRSLMNVTFPYPNEPLALVKNSHVRMLFDFKKKSVVWKQNREGEHNSNWSSASKAVAYMSENQLYIRTTENEKRQLTTDGSREIVYGEAVHRNEWGIDEGLFWSPDGQQLAFYRMDQSMVTDYPQVNIDPRIAQAEPDKYPMAGMTSHLVTVCIYDLRTRKTVYLQTGDPTDRYFTNISWSPDSKSIYMFELNRDQNDCRLNCYDAATGQFKSQLYRETNDKYVEPLHPIVFLPWDDSSFILQSQKDGYNHLYLCSTKGGKTKQLTSGPWVVLDVLGFNKKQKAVVIASNETHPLQRNLFAVELSTNRRIALDNGEGVHYARLSETGNCLYDKYSTPNTTPNTINLIRLSTRLKPLTSCLLAAADPWQEYVVPVYENGTIKAADGTTDLFFRIVKPHDFDPAKKYPTIVYVYGGPHAHNVDASWHWHSRSWETYMAQKGYIVFILDNRGSENRGRDFEQATFQQLGQIEMQDQMRGVEYLRTLPYIDTERLGVHGWSFGGFMTISLMTNYPDVFKVGVAGGPVIDWKWYEVMYGERYMDTPEQNPEGYAKTSLIAKAADLKGKLQIIIGYNDPTVVPQHALAFLQACAEAGTQPDFFAYPGEGHNMMGHNSVHLHERITQYFEDYLK